MPRFALFMLLLASMTTGLGVAAMFGAVGAYQVARGVRGQRHPGRDGR